MKRAAGDYFAPMAFTTAVSALVLLTVFGVRRAPLLAGKAAAGAALLLVAAYLAIPSWRRSFVELLRPGTHVTAQVAKEIGELLPKDAIVLGERSNQVLMSLPIRTSTTFVANSDPVPVVRAILKAEPSAKLYALADTQHSYNLRHYREHADEMRLKLVKTFKLPSFASGAPCDVHLCEIVVK